MQTIERVRRCEVPPPSLQNPAVPPELDAIILKALARNPADRWADAADMADALDDVVHASRFQPTHLAQLLYDLFPIEGGGPPRADHPGDDDLARDRVQQPALADGAAGLADRLGRRAAPRRSTRGVGAVAQAEVELPRRSTWRWRSWSVAAAVGWKMYGHKLVRLSRAMARRAIRTGASSST